MFTDSHAHLSIDKLQQILPALLARAESAHVSRIINIATTAEELKAAILLHKEYPWVFPAGATTPHDVETLGEKEFVFFAAAAKEKKIVAIGETGLDYHYKHSNPTLQKSFLIRYAHLALETGLPLIIHCREAFADLFSILDKEYPQAPLVLHCFTGTLQEAQRVIDRGWYLSLAGIVTFKNCGDLEQVAQLVPLDHLLIETDTPYLAPHPYRGKQNEPSFLIETGKRIAALRGISYEELATAITENATRLFF